MPTLRQGEWHRKGVGKNNLANVYMSKWAHVDDSNPGYLLLLGVQARRQSLI